MDQLENQSYTEEDIDIVIMPPREFVYFYNNS